MNPPTEQTIERNGVATPGRFWTPYQLYFIVLVLAVSICNYVDRGILPLLQEMLKADLNLRDGDIGLLTGPFFVTFYALSAIPVARLAERVNRARLLAAAVAMWSAFTALCGLAGNLSSLIALRLGVGFAEGGGVPITHSMLSDEFPQRRRGLAMAVLSAAQPLAAMLMPIIGAYVATIWGWRAAFMIVGSSGLVLAALVLTLREPRDALAAAGTPRIRRPFAADLRWLLGNRAYVWLFVAGAFMGMGNGGVGVFLVSFIMREHSRSLVEAGSVLGINGAMGLLGTIAGGYLADRFTGKRGRSYPLVCAIGALTAALLYWGAFAQSAWIPSMALLLIAGLVRDLKNGPNFAAVQNLVPPHMRATAAGLYMLGPTLIGFSLGPPLTGFLSDHLAANLFDGGSGSFGSVCHATKGAMTAIESCRRASAAGLTSALMITNFAYIASAIAFYMCSRSYVSYEAAEATPGSDGFRRP